MCSHLWSHLWSHFCSHLWSHLWSHLCSHVSFMVLVGGKNAKLTKIYKRWPSCQQDPKCETPLHTAVFSISSPPSSTSGSSASSSTHGKTVKSRASDVSRSHRARFGRRASVEPWDQGGEVLQRLLKRNFMFFWSCTRLCHKHPVIQKRPTKCSKG